MLNAIHGEVRSPSHRHCLGNQSHLQPHSHLSFIYALGHGPGHKALAANVDTSERATLCAMTMTREQSLSAIQSEKLEVPSGDLTSITARAFLNRASHLEASKRRLVAMELAMRLWLGLLARWGPYYVDFESVLWLHFSQNVSPEDQIRTIPTSAGIGVDVEGLYHMFLREMFVASGKTRHQFYQDMLLEVGIQMKLTDAEFGEKAMQFYERVAESVHAEHLLVFYSVGLLIRAYMAMDHKCSLPIADEELEKIYRHFERAIPLGAAFIEYAADDAHFNSEIKAGFYPKAK